MPRKTFHVELPRELTEDERALFKTAIQAAWVVVAGRADRHADLAPHVRHLKRHVRNLDDLHTEDDGHGHKPKKGRPDADLGTRVFPEEDPLVVAQIECGDCHRTLVADDPEGFLVCPQVRDHPGRVGLCHVDDEKCVVDCGWKPTERVVFDPPPTSRPESVEVTHG
jgi:hypothetical protein